MVPTARARLPTEVLEEIFQLAWDSTVSVGERQMLLSTFALADPVLHGHLRRTATRNVILDVSGFHTYDLDLYAALADRAAVESGIRVGVDSKSSSPRPEVDQKYGLEVPECDVLEFRANLFRHSHLRIEGLTGASDLEAHRHTDTTHHPYKASDVVYSQSWGYVLTKLTHIVPDARSVIVTPARSSSLPVSKQAISRLLFTALRFFPSLRSMHLAMSFKVLNRLTVYSAPLARPIPQLTSLRLTHAPVCECPRWDRVPCRADGHLEYCLAATLLEGFPNLRHLHLENPVVLKTLCPPVSLRTLTLEAPPMRRVGSRRVFGSLIEYYVNEAVENGFMSAPLAGADKNEDQVEETQIRKIVVLTGTEKPFGWASAKAACEEAGIELVQVVEYQVDLCSFLSRGPMLVQ